MAKDLGPEPCVSLWLWRRRGSCHLSHHGQPLPADGLSQPALPSMPLFSSPLGQHSHSLCYTHPEPLCHCNNQHSPWCHHINLGATARGNVQAFGCPEKMGCHFSSLLNVLRWINPRAQAHGEIVVFSGFPRWRRN